MTRLLVIFAVLCASLLSPAAAHELRPAYLQLDETAPGQFSVLWKVPALSDRRLGLYLSFPETCQNLGEPVGSMENAAYFERWQMVCEGGLKGRAITIDGLRSTLTDVLARISWADGSVEVARLTPEDPSLTLRGAQTGFEVARTYFLLGVEHILGGLDHLLFVLALMLLIRKPWMLVKTITAFTVAHSITLTGATLDYLTLPPAPVETVIALSIAFVAREFLLVKPGQRRLSEAYPWVVAFAFGLLHGFGFAGALKQIGLPQSDVLLALFTFNLGVEAGQLLFVTALFILAAFARHLSIMTETRLRFATAYLIGIMATYWLFERLLAFA